MSGSGRKWNKVLAMLFAATLLWGCDGDNGATGPQGPQGPEGPRGPEGLPGVSATPVDLAKPEACATCHGGAGSDHQAIYDKYVDQNTIVMTIDGASSAAEVGGTFTVTVNLSITKDGLPYVTNPNFAEFDQKSFYMVQYNSTSGEYRNSSSLLQTTTVNGVRLATNIAAGVNPGEYVLTRTGQPYAPEAPVAPFDGAQVYGYIAAIPLFSHDTGEAGSELPPGTHVHLYDEVSNAALAFGTAQATNLSAYKSAASVDGCVNCHGSPYLKHGYRDPIVAGLPDFAACKSCHFDDRNGGHQDWQYMVDDPLNWATGGADTGITDAQVETKYAYKAKLMNDVHMAHAMEFPFPRSMANCATCHQTPAQLAQVLDNSNFTAETCKSCHPVEGRNAWPEAVGTVAAGEYAQPERAPPLSYLWAKHEVTAVHDITATCTTCHGNAAVPNAPPFNELHTGYDTRITNDSGQKYRDLFTASIDSVAYDDVNDTMTITFSADASAITNAVAGTLDVHVYVSFYGWDSKHFIVPSHTRDDSNSCQRWSNGTSSATDCRFEMSTRSYTDDPNNADPSKAYISLFPALVEDPAGTWTLTVDLAAWIGGQPGAVPDLIADGTIKKAEVTLAPRLRIVGHDDEAIPANLDAVTQTYDLVNTAMVDDYFKLANATVDVAKCENCHDQLAVTWHTGSGRGGDIVACKNCHNPTYPGSHVEMASRSIDNYVHAIHSFQAFDVDRVFHDDAPPGDPAHSQDFDPVRSYRYDNHIKHIFPNFTARQCEGCHVTPGDAVPGGGTYPAVTYNVPDQTKSIPGVLSPSDDVHTWYKMVDRSCVGTRPCIPSAIPQIVNDGRNISSSIPEYITGPASRACGGCHRANSIKTDDPGTLASFNAHTEMGGTYIENEVVDDVEDTYLFAIINKIMKAFE